MRIRRQKYFYSLAKAVIDWTKQRHKEFDTIIVEVHTATTAIKEELYTEIYWLCNNIIIYHYYYYIMTET